MPVYYNFNLLKLSAEHLHYCFCRSYKNLCKGITQLQNLEIASHKYMLLTSRGFYLAVYLAVLGFLFIFVLYTWMILLSVAMDSLIVNTMKVLG